MGRGGKSLFEKKLGVSHNTINLGIKELKSGKALSLSSGLRKKGGGRKSKIDNAVWEQIKDFIEPHSRGEPESPLQWVSKSLRNIEQALKESGINVSYRILGDALKHHGFSLQSNRKAFEGKGHKDRDDQFEFINRKVKEHQSDSQPVISVDVKKRELVGITKDTAEFAI